MNRAMKSGGKFMKRLAGWAAGILLLAAMPAFGQQATPQPVAAATGATTPTAASSSESSTPQLQQRDQRYHIEAADTFDVAFELSPEFNQTLTVQPDGYVTLKAIGDVKVVGQTVPELTQTLRTAYGKILNDPMISISLKDFEKPYFFADGQLARPGKYEMRGTVTLAEAVAIAGGFTEAAKHSQVLLFRRVDDQWIQAKIFNMKQMEKSGNLHEDPTLHPGDLIVVPKNALSKIRTFLPQTGIGAYSQLYAPH
jgi:polysaccharide biosynthesis/export protein